ncbi:MAG: prephenate dehydratase [Thermodesulfobacteriota bacterium]
MEPKTIKNLREDIDRIDREILLLISMRASHAREVGRLKKACGRAVFDPAREQEVIADLLKQNPGPLPDCALRHVFTELISACRELQEPLKIAYLGPEATFCHQASLAYFGRSCRFLACESIPDVFRQVERGKAHFGVVPIENSTEGAVGTTLDELVCSELKITGEAVLRISHAVMSQEEDLARIEKVYSHPQALAQCQGWLRTNLPGRTLVPTSSTASAAALVAKEPRAAAVGSPVLAEIHGLAIVADEIQDLAVNLTRFLVLGTEEASATGQDKTSVLFATGHRPGALKDALGPFSEQEINMTRIESRPSKQAPWEYVFFVDIEGHKQDISVRKALDSLARCTTRLKVLGSYPMAHPNRKERASSADEERPELVAVDSGR